MKENNRHTFIIVAYKKSPYLEECILSLQKQTIKSKIIISTSTPSPFLSKLAEKYHIPLIINNCADGIGSDWSFAYSNCTTKYLTLAHQDDLYLPKYTESCLCAADRQDSDNLITFTDYSELIKGRSVNSGLIFFIKKIILSVFLLKKSIKSLFGKKTILSFGNPISCPSVMYNKEHIGSFEFSKNFLCSLDWDTWLRLSSMDGSFIYVRKKLMVHRIHKDSEAFLQTKNKIRKAEDELIFKRLWPASIAKLFASMYYIASKSGRLN
ncbi:MAG: glycosyltransferase family 2 protein [Elusimicrobia bacterium]|nr:glycosyltransferase family 2 protein [Elusimicrobiota bacterium]